MADQALTEEELREIRTRLAADLEALRGQLEDLRAAAAPVSLDLSIGRLSRMDAMQQQQMATATRQRVEVELRQVEAALRRLDGDDYGACVACGGEIERRRLRARPASTTCLPCGQGGRSSR